MTTQTISLVYFWTDSRIERETCSVLDLVKEDRSPTIETYILESMLSYRDFSADFALFRLDTSPREAYIISIESEGERQ